MAKKKASLIGRGADILFGAKTPAPPESAKGEPQPPYDFETNQQDFGDASDAVDAAPAAPPASAQPASSASTGTPRDYAVSPPVLPPPVTPAPQPTDSLSVPPRSYYIPPAPSNEPVDQPGVPTAPRPPVPPPRGTTAPPGSMPTMTGVIPTPTSQPTYPPTSTGQPATSPGGTVSPTTTPPPARPTAVVPPATTGIPSPTSAAPTNGAGTQPSSTTIPTPTTGGSGRPTSPVSSGSVPPLPSASPIPTPPPTTAADTALAMQWGGLTLADIVRLATQRAAEADTAQKTKESYKVDADTVKEFRARLFGDIQELYSLAGRQVQDSPAVADFCLDLLKKARLIILSADTAGDLSTAEFYVEKVRSKIGRSADPVPQPEVRHVTWILIWQGVFLAVCLVLATLPWTTVEGVLRLSSLTVQITPIFIPVLAALGWGGVGGVMGALYNLTWWVQMREYDPAYNLDYVTRPVKGLIVGSIIFLIVLGGVVMVSGTQILASSRSGDNYSLIFLVAVLSGFKQEYVFEMFDNILRVIFRNPPTTPKQIDPNSVAK